MPRGRCSAFTLIELLTVIAIIAVLAAILLPVFARVRENARQTTCISNLHQIGVALSLYRDDNGEYPALLLGYAENANGLPWAPGDSPAPVPANRIQHGFLLGKYLRNDINVFHCPDNTHNDMSQAAVAAYAPGSVLSGAVPNVGDLGIDVPDAYKNRPLYLYTFDSYDLTALIDANGNTNGSFALVYSRNWTGGSGTADAPNQLKYRNAPPDKTVVTWCNYHVATAHGEMCPVLLASGTAKPLPYRRVLQLGWNLANQ